MGKEEYADQPFRSTRPLAGGLRIQKETQSGIIVNLANGKGKALAEKIRYNIGFNMTACFICRKLRFWTKIKYIYF